MIKRLFLFSLIFLLVFTFSFSSISASNYDDNTLLNLADFLSNEIPSLTSHVKDPFIPTYPISIESANHLLTWQLDYEGLGGWGKDFNERQYTRDWDGIETKSHTYTQDNKVPTSSIDNNATTSHIEFLAATYGQYGGEAYKTAVYKAIDMILFMQHPEGSFPENYPEQTWEPSSFENRGTIMQMLHHNVMSMYQKILTDTYPFNNDMFDATYKQKIQESYNRGLDFIIKSQVVQNGVLTGWAGKYDESTYTPRWARNFEPPSINTFDTAMILFHLISIPDKTPEINNAIAHGALFMYETAMVDMKYTHNSYPYFVEAPGEKVWYKFLELGTNRGIVAENGIIYYSISDLSAERISGYGWGSERGFQFYDKVKEFLNSNNLEPPIEEPPIEEPPVEEPPAEEPSTGYENYSITIYGSTTTYIYDNQASSQYNAIVRNSEGETLADVTWEVQGDNEVSITQEGLLLIGPNAKEGIITITAYMTEANSIIDTYEVNLLYHSSKTIEEPPAEEPPAEEPPAEEPPAEEPPAEDITLGKSEKRYFIDDNRVINNPDRGAAVTEENALIEVSSVSTIAGDQYKINFYGNPHLHEIGSKVEWYAANEDFSMTKGKAIVSGWDGNNNIYISNIEGQAPQNGDYFKNYFGDNSIYFFRMTWKEIEPIKGTYDFSKVLNNPRYNFAKAQGMKVVFRLNMNWPNTSGAPGEIDIPQWLYNEINGDGTWYSISYHEGIDSAWGFSPNYSNSLLINYHKNLIQAIANEFGNDTLHAQIGSLGHWGELHGYMPNEDIQRQYYQHYVDAFGHDKVSMRRNMNFMRENNIPVYFDMLGSAPQLGGDWNEWWGTITWMDEGYTDDEGIYHAPYPTFREAGPIGGEHAPWYDGQPYIYDYSNQTSGRRYSETLAMAKALEMSYVYMITPSFGLQDIEKLEFQDNVDDFMRRLGYRFLIAESSYYKGETDIDLNIVFKNNGIAQSYKNYPVYINFYDVNGDLLLKRDLNIPLSQIPQESQQEFIRKVENYPVGYDKFGIEIENVEMPLKSNEIIAGVYEIGNIQDILNDEVIIEEPPVEEPPVEEPPVEEPPAEETGYEAYTVTIYGSDITYIYDNIAESQYSGVVRNEEGETVEALLWEVSEAIGISITQDGILIIEPNAEEGAITITAKLVADSSIIGTKNVLLEFHSSKTIEEPPIEEPPIEEPPIEEPTYSITIYGSDIVYLYNGVSKSQYSAIIRDENGEINTEVIWEVSGIEGVSIDNTGLLKIGPKTQEGSIVIKATINLDPSIISEYSVQLIYHSSRNKK